ncbi:hypothetical protein CL618_00800 [archaeon]|nr:hypothetical protein [archaeon]|tara:strand:- start:35 stop:448 length:414 start_codon:yes stop_codon:yes gene_type:complete
MLKKGASPLIATVLLVGFVIVIAALILSWSVSLINQGVEKSESDIVFFCVSEIGFEVSNVCDGSFEVENLKSRSIDKFIVSLLGEGFEEVDGLSGYGTDEFTFSKDVDEITVIPVVIVNEQEIVCSSIGIKEKVNNC